MSILKSSKPPKRFERVLHEIYDLSDMLKQQGQYDGKCGYLEIMAEILLFIEDSLRVIRGFLACGLGLLIGRLLSALFMGGQ